jgi:hypothetical protein
MAILNERAFAKLAAAAAKDLVDHQIPLNDSVEKIAELHGLNSEQVARLCEATNNAAFDAVFKEREKTGSDDRHVEFPLADTKVVLEKRASAMKTASARPRTEPEFDAAWESRPLSRREEAPAVESSKTASAEDDAPRFRARTIDPTPKVLDELRIEKLACLYRCTGAIEKLTAHYRPDARKDAFAEFEKDAMALHGAAADPFLDILRDQLRMPKVTRDHAKTASRLVISDSTKEHKLFKEALEAYGKSMDIQLTLERHGRG